MSSSTADYTAIDISEKLTLEGHSVERIYLRQMSSDGSVNKTTLKPLLALAARRQYLYVGFSQRKIPRSSAASWQPMQGCKVPSYAISEKAIRFRYPNYDPDGAQKLISSSVSRHLSTRNISSKSMHAFLSNLAQRQTDRQTDKRDIGRKSRFFSYPFHSTPPLGGCRRNIGIPFGVQKPE